MQKSNENPKKHPFGLDDDEILSLKITIIMTGVTFVLLYFFMLQQSQLGIVLSAGAIGGFLHEFVQSKGRILFIQQKEDGLYLGSISGLILGMVAGILVYGGTISINGSQGSPTPQHLEQLLFESLIAGLALKGVSEAAMSPAKSKDEFDIAGVSFEDEKNGKITVHLKNNSGHKLQLQLVNITDPTNQMFVQNVSLTVEPKGTISIPPISYKWNKKQEYTITVTSLNGKTDPYKATSPA